MVTETGTEPPTESASEDQEFNLEQLKELLGLFIRAPRRHPRLATLSLLAALMLGLAIAMFAPRYYDGSVRILAQKNAMMPAINPNREQQADSPTKNAADNILQRDNIVAMIKQLDLIDRWETTRQPILRLKDRVSGAFSGPRSDDDRMMDMVGFLEKQLTVVADESSISISVDWPNRDLAFEIVSFLQKNFLEARYDSNVNVIVEAIRILEERAKPQSAEVDAALADLTRIEAQRRPQATVGATAATPVRSYGRVRRVPTPSPGGTTAVAGGDGGGSTAEELEDVRRRIRLLKEDHDRQLVQTQTQLSDARATLGPMHPTVVALNEKLSELSGPPAGLAALVARERRLLGDLSHASTPAPTTTIVQNDPGSAPAPAAPAAPSPPATGSSTRGSADLKDDPEISLALSKLEAVSAKYNEMLSRIEAANIELEVTRAAFKYQYTVVRPPELARKPSKPNVPLILIASILIALLLTVLVPGGLDLMRGRFVEEWQLERKLGLPLLGELTPPR